MIGYHTLGYILYNYDYITVYVSCVDIFLDLSDNISRYFLGILQRKNTPCLRRAVFSLYNLSVIAPQCHLP